jgi:hypothetical protein
MGISTNFYTIYGIKVEWDDAFNDAYDEVYDDEDTPFVLTDGMSGEYMVFGAVLFDSGDARWGFEEGDSFKEIDTNTLVNLELGYRTEFLAKFPEFAYIIEQPFKLMTLAHYS